MPKQKEQFDEMRLLTIQKIKNAGLKLFSKKGLAATNIKEIAKEAGISLGLIYHYFKSKEELYLSLANEAMDKSQLALEGIISQSVNARDKISSFIDSYLHGVQKEDGIYYFIIISQPYLTGNEEEDLKLNDRKMQSIKRLEGIIQEGQLTGECVPGDPFQLAATFISATQGIASFKLMFGDSFILPEKDLLLRLLIKS
ncbi:TetR/AcrR family transcriptional regulator [Paenibacillus sp. ATY16]|uniref:TetR/AcrR family transcriptional regulator n=1 Tax=Paenibacillus sp. ATY16 TaxID=1759312 RepID=UPI00200E9E68|nr:TetR/AcrR family transcriptional regulator [Paenibacillus sp. ATY16]MCK9862617.1 TetR/AcrR family transcriptional regulator [Paenibacillus sp. ATY16]